ncbi:MgtC/SapB family protein [Brachybacterium hainanense]|uniref:MgtC/SapB family protein n=1 Tax=Brachybacterium hainanense TaxID=1541174 RepID=A0ABV6R8X9_9MICO
MIPLIGIGSPTLALEIELLGMTFLLCSLIGVERQFQRKYAGYRTHVLVGLGSCAFTMVSGYGFAAVLGTDVTLDPSRIAAQIVSGIGFLGAGVIFKGRSTVRGLTTAATIWVAAAIGMACGAGMLSLGIILTLLHLVTLWVVAPLVRRIPDRDRRRTLRLTYVDGKGVLRSVLGAATDMGCTVGIIRTRRTAKKGEEALVHLDAKFFGKPPIHDLVTELTEVDGVRRVQVLAQGEDADDD